ncbi:MAG: hypothetical protein JWN15_3901 [Firmicutes bacterium]|nr:hypothetical protein [Bacillota bacterium]
MMPIGAKVHSGFQRPDPDLVAQRGDVIVISAGGGLSTALN